MKGIILAGGSGTRLHPMTQVISKQLLPIYDKPMIYYPLTTLMLAGIREILIISTPQRSAAVSAPARRRRAMGRSLSYAEQPRPRAWRRPIIIGADFVAGQTIGPGARRQSLLWPRAVRLAARRRARAASGATVFAYHVHDPERYGVVEFDAAGRATVDRGKAAAAAFQLGGDRALFL